MRFFRRSIVWFPALMIVAAVCVSCSSATPVSGSTPSATGTSTGSASAPPSTVAADAGQHLTQTVTVSGGTRRTYRLYVPTKASAPGSRVPLLVALHGGGGSADHFESIAGFDALADQYGFVVAYPDAGHAGGARVSSWNAGGCCGRAARTDADDVGFVRQVISTVSDQRRVDGSRVYVAGFSNGGMLAYRAACQLADTVAAVGVQSATLEFRPCQPARPVSLLGIHGTADDHVPLAGGRGSESATTVDFTPPRQAAATVAAADGCAVETRTSNGSPAPADTSDTWVGCPRGVAVEFVTVSGGTHPWMPASPGLIWSFLAAHPRPSG